MSNNEFLTLICVFGIATFQWSIEWVTYFFVKLNVVLDFLKLFNLNHFNGDLLKTMLIVNSYMWSYLTLVKSSYNLRYVQQFFLKEKLN